MSRQRLRALQRQIDKIIMGPYPESPGDRARELIELDSLIEEIGSIMLSRLESKPDRTSTDRALYYYLSGRVRR